MQEAIEVTLRVTSVLEQLGVRYVVGGSIASSLHGVVDLLDRMLHEAGLL